MRRIAISPRSAAFPTRNSSPTPLPLRQRRQADRSNFSMSRSGASKFAALSIAAALATIALKALAWWLTDSVGLLSDAIEGTINLAGATVALAMISLAAGPPDEEHAFGYSKAEYFSSGLEGT